MNQKPAIRITIRPRMAIQAHRGALPDELVALTGLPTGTVLESIGLLEAAGLASTDLLRRCTIAPAYD